MDKDTFIAITNIDVMEEIDMDIGPDTVGENTDIVDPDVQVGDVLQVDIRNLVADPSRYNGQQIAVLGKFRGNNLYGDLSIRDKRTPRDFVIKAADAAIWVTGRRPRGDGFRLDPKKRRDTGKWLTVIGQPWYHEDSGIYYLRAEKIEIAEKPDRKELEPVKVVDPRGGEAGAAAGGHLQPAPRGRARHPARYGVQRPVLERHEPGELQSQRRSSLRRR